LPQALEFLQFLQAGVRDLGGAEVELPQALEFLQVPQIKVRDLVAAQVNSGT
jgi:hypothetical protein